MKSHKLLVPLAAILIFFNYTLYTALSNQQSRRIEATVAERLDIKVAESENSMHLIVAALELMGKRWEARGSTPRNEWANDATQIIRSLPGLRTLEWVDANHVVRWIVPQAGNERLQNLSLDADTSRRDALLLAKKERKTVVTRSLDFEEGGKEFVINSPVFIGERFDGYIVGVVSSHEFFSNIGKRTDASNREWLRVTFEQLPLFDSRSNLDDEKNDSKFASQNLTLLGLPLHFQGGASPQEMVVLSSHLPSVVLSAGLLISLLLLGTAHLTQRTQRLLRNAELESKRFNQVFESSPSAMLMSDSQGRIAMANVQAERSFGYAREEMIGRAIEMLIPQQFRHHHPELRNGYLHSPQSRGMGVGRELYGLHKDGTEFPLEIGLSPIDTHTGKMFLASVVDITERKRQSEIIKKNLKELDRMSHTAKVGGWEVDVASNVLSWTEETYRIHGLPLDAQPTLEDAVNFYAPEARPVIQAAVDHAMATGEGWDVELPLLRTTGERIWVRAMGQVEFAHAVPVRLTGTLQDVTARKLVMNELARRNSELDNFAYVASHDLKSPLRGIDQLATWLAEDLEGTIPASAVEHLRLMRVRINRLENLLDNLLAYSRAGRIEGSPEMLDCGALVREVFELCRGNGVFSLKLEGDFPEFVTSRTPLELVFRNLINNAIKHHDRTDGEITVKVLAIHDQFEFSVADDGAGIAPEHFERVFGMFQTLRPRDAVEGSGMGLAIVKKTIESFGGTIQVAAHAPRGVVFTFTWPARMDKQG